MGDCNTTNETFTFTVGKGNTFKAVQSTSGDPNRVCVIDLEPTTAPNNAVIVTTIFSMKITNGTGRFKGLVGTIVEDGTILPNLGPTGLIQPTGRTSANLQDVLRSELTRRRPGRNRANRRPRALTSLVDVADCMA